jgi:hypothetical protein
MLPKVSFIKENIDKLDFIKIKDVVLKKTLLKE